jgi:hypothetical protein
VKWAIVVALSMPTVVRADPLELGLQLGLPGHGSGVPLMAGEQFAFGVTARVGLAPATWADRAIDVSIGTPIAGAGVSLWGGLELRRSITPRLAAYTIAGVRAGFAGPLYYARHSGVFVGFAYIYSGPLTIGPHVPLGLATTFGRVNAYVEAFAEVPLLPSPQLMFGGAAGVRVSL